MQSDAELHNFAWDKRIVIVCPSTLFATLKTIEAVRRLERQNKNTQDIAKRGSLLYENVVGFAEDMQKIGDRLNATKEVYDKALGKLSTGPGNIIRQTEDLKALGVKASKTMPKELLEDETERVA